MNQNLPETPPQPTNNSSLSPSTKQENVPSNESSMDYDLTPDNNKNTISPLVLSAACPPISVSERPRTPTLSIPNSDGLSCSVPARDKPNIPITLPSTSSPSSSKDEGEGNPSTPPIAVNIPKWSEVLNSPNNQGGMYSPSVPNSKSMHGIGLTVTVEHIKSISRCTKKCCTLFTDIASLHDIFASSIFKSAQSLSNICPEGVNTRIAKCMKDVQSSIISFSRQEQGLAICIKGSIARPLEGNVRGLEETVPGLYKRYMDTKEKCKDIRNDALKSKKLYVKCVKDAEVAIFHLQRVKDKDSTSLVDENNVGSGDGASSSPAPPQSTDCMNSGGFNNAPNKWEETIKKFSNNMQQSNSKDTMSKHVNRVISALDAVQTNEASYREMVEVENQAVEQCQTMERMGLESLQKLEEERILFVLESLDRFLQADKGALDNMSLSLRRYSEDVVDPDKTTNKSPTHVERKDSSAGVNEALTLKLPEEVGILRDVMRENLSVRNTRFQSTKKLYTFCEELATVADSFATGIISRLGTEGYGFNSAIKNNDALSNSLKIMAEKEEVKSWNAVIDTISNCATTASDLATELRKLNLDHLSKVVINMERDTKTVNENEDSRWKRICDSAKTESRARARSDQSLSDLTKAKERLETIEKEEPEAGDDAQKGNRMNAQMSKAIGNMFSILPGGGEEAMAKVLNVNSRLAIAKTNVKDAEAKVEKEKIAVANAVSKKNTAIASYIQTAQEMDDAFGQQEEKGWGEMNETLDGTISAFLNFRDTRYKSILPAVEIVKDGNQNSKAEILDLTDKLQKRVSMSCGKMDSKGSPAKDGSLKSIRRRGQDDFFALEVELEESKNVNKLISIMEGEGEVSSRKNKSPIDSNKQDCDDPTGKPAAESPSAETKSSNAGTTDNIGDGTDKVSASGPNPKAQSSSSSDRAHSAHTTELMSLAAVLKENPSGSSSENVATASSSTLKTPATLTPGAFTKSSETDLFLTHFCEEAGIVDGDESQLPAIIESFSCAYWPNEDEGYISPLLHGRMFVTQSTLFFVGWGGKKVVLDWENVSSIKKDTTAGGLVDNAVSLTCIDEEGNERVYFFGSFVFRQKAFQLLDRLVTVSRSLHEINSGKRGKKKRKVELPKVAADEIVKKMEKLFGKNIKGTSIKQFYDICWSEGEGGVNADPFYQPYLVKKGMLEVAVGKWDFASGSGGKSFANEWCGESYDQKRVITYKYKRTTHLYVGPPIAGVTETHHCRVEGNDKCVLALTVKMDGIPYADCFCVEARWIARRVGVNDLQIDAGIFVDMKKSTMFTKQIKSGTITESKPAHLELFDDVKNACVKFGGNDQEDDGSDGESEASIEEEEEDHICSEEEESISAQVVRCINMARSESGKALNVVTAQISKTIGVKNPRTFLFFIFFCFLLIMLRGLKQGTSHESFEKPTADPAINNIDILTQKVDNLEIEIQNLHQTLSEVLSVLQESLQESKSGQQENNAMLPEEL